MVSILFKEFIRLHNQVNISFYKMVYTAFKIFWLVDCTLLSYLSVNLFTLLFVSKHNLTYFNFLLEGNCYKIKFLNQRGNYIKVEMSTGWSARGPARANPSQARPMAAFW